MPVQLTHEHYSVVSDRAWRRALIGLAFTVASVGIVTLLAYLPYLGGLPLLHNLLTGRGTSTARLTSIRFYGDNWEAICTGSSLISLEGLLRSNDFWMGCCTRPDPTDRFCECAIEMTFDSNYTAHCKAAFWWREEVRGHLQVPKLAPTLTGDRGHHGIYLDQLPDDLKPIFDFIGRAAVASEPIEPQHVLFQ